MKRSLNSELAKSDPEHYDPNIVTYNYFYAVPVSNGAKYFDARYPGWARRVDLQTFNMSYTNADILAQIHGMDTRLTPEYTAWSPRILRAHGLWSLTGASGEYDALSVAWRECIVDRLNGVGE